MNWKRILIAFVIVYIVYEIINFIVHGLILSGVYESIGIWRSDMESKMWIMYLGEILFALFFVFIFAKGYEGKGIMEGLRYGLIIGCFVTIPGMLAQYAVYPVSFTLTVEWIVFGFIQMIIIGIIAALIYKPKETPPTTA